MQRPFLQHASCKLWKERPIFRTRPGGFHAGLLYAITSRGAQSIVIWLQYRQTLRILYRPPLLLDLRMERVGGMTLGVRELNEAI
jgi:hypothetical protein